MHSLQEEADGRGVSDVQGCCGPSTTREEASDAPDAVDDHRTRVPHAREGAGLAVKLKDGPLFRSLGIFTVAVVPCVGENVVGAADGQSGGAATLDHNKTLAAVMVGRNQLTHLPVRNGAFESQKAVERILGGMAILKIEAHHLSEVPARDASAKVDGVAVEIARVDLGGIDLNDSPVLGITLATAPDPGADGRREDNMT